jgi:hypothetical protein
VELEVDEVARKIVENININISSPDDGVWLSCNQLLYSSFL